MECSLPMDGRRVSLTQLSKDSFRECQAILTLTDLLIIIFSGISVSVVAIMTSFFLASTVHCFQRWSKGTKGDEEESEEWKGFAFYNLFGPGMLFEDTEDIVHLLLIPTWWIARTVEWYGYSLHMDNWNMVIKDILKEWEPLKVCGCAAPRVNWYYQDHIFVCESLLSLTQRSYVLARCQKAYRNTLRLKKKRIRLNKRSVAAVLSWYSLRKTKNLTFIHSGHSALDSETMLSDIFDDFWLGLDLSSAILYLLMIPHNKRMSSSDLDHWPQ